MSYLYTIKKGRLLALFLNVNKMLRAWEAHPAHRFIVENVVALTY